MSRPLGDFAQRTNLEPESVRTVIDTARRALPWYVETAIGIGAWIAGLLCAGGVLGLGFASKREALGLLVLGVAMMAGGVAFGRSGGVFRRQFALSLVLSGQLAALAAADMTDRGLWLMALLAVMLALVLLPLVRDAAHQFVSVAIACGCTLAAMVERGDGSGAMLFAASVLLPALWLLLRPPPRLDLRPAAHALLLASPAVFAVLDVFSIASASWTAHVGRGVLVVAAAVVLWRLWREAGSGGVLTLAAFAVVAAVAVLLPPGLANAALILLLAYALGSPALAAIGAVAEGLFLIRLYYSLQLDLMAKSELLAGIGAMLLLLWLGWRRLEVRS